MGLNTLRKTMWILRLALLLLVLLSVAATSWISVTQNKDGLIINLAGRQRMLIQQMVSLTLQIENHPDIQTITRLQETAEIFDESLYVLSDGGESDYPADQITVIPSTRNTTVRAELDKLRRLWTAFSPYLDDVATEQPGSSEFEIAVRNVEQGYPQLLQQADEIVRQYEISSEQKVARLRWIQVFFLAFALAFLVSGTRITMKSILVPLNELDQAAERIGHGDFDEPVIGTGPYEIRSLARRFDTMRAHIKESRDYLETKVTQRTRELEALYDVTRDISARLEVEHTLHSVTNKARELLQSDISFLCLLDDQGGLMHLETISGSEEAISAKICSARYSPASKILESDSALICSIACTGSCAMIAPAYRQSHLAAPLRIEKRIIGALCVGSRQLNAYSDEHVILLTKLANFAAIALDNARLFQQAERAAMLEERQRIAAEMHDGLAQTLSYLKLKTDKISILLESGQNEAITEELVLSNSAIMRANRQIRESIANLMSESISSTSLQDQLSRLVEEASQHTDVKIKWQPDHEAPVTLMPDDSTEVLRIAGEAIQNALQHSGGQVVSINFGQRENSYCLKVQDDGTGFNPEAFSTNGRRHFGLSIMEARAVRLGGNLTVNTQADQGTSVLLYWPISGRGENADV